jgi:hypothetical protein
VAGCALLVLLAGVVLALVPRGSTSQQDTARGVRELAAILDFSAIGNDLSHHNNFSGALRNRRQVAERLTRFHPPRALRRATATFSKVTQLAIRYNDQRLAGLPKRVWKATDHQANALRSVFFKQFNPLARSYLHRSYGFGQI